MPKFDENPYEHIQDISLSCSVAAGSILAIGSLFSLELVGIIAGLFLIVIGSSAKGVLRLILNRVMMKANIVCVIGGGIIFPFGFYHEAIFLIPLIMLCGWLAIFYGNFDSL
jgi:hypothetical protein